VRVLQRLRVDRPRRDVDELALVLPVVLHPDARDEVHRLLDHGWEIIEVVAERARLLLRAALAKADVQPAARQDVEGGAALGDLHRMIHVRR